MSAQITPDERAAMRALADRMETYYGEADAASGIRRLLDELDTAEAEAARLREQRETDLAVHEAYLRLEREEARKNLALAKDAKAVLKAALVTYVRVREKAERAEAEVARLREEAARPAPVWDEENAVEDMARAAHDAFCDAEEEDTPKIGWSRWDETSDHRRDVARRQVDAVLAVMGEHSLVRPAPAETVRPDREAVLGAIKHHLSPPVGRNRLREAEGKPYDADDLARGFERATDAVLDLWPDESRATVQTEALRAFVNDVDACMLKFAEGGTYPDLVEDLANLLDAHRSENDRLDPRRAAHG